MKFFSKRYSIKIPSEITLIYCNKTNVLLVKTKTKKRLLNVNVKLLILKDKNILIVTNRLTKLVTSNSKNFIKTIRGITVSLIKRTMSDIQVVKYTKLKLIGVGYKVFETKSSSKNKNTFLHFKLGYSHSLYYKIPPLITIKTVQSTKLFISSYCSTQLSQCTAVIKNCKLPEPYKGKGIVHSNEIIKLKEGKKI